MIKYKVQAGEMEGTLSIENKVVTGASKSLSPFIGLSFAETINSISAEQGGIKLQKIK